MAVKIECNSCGKPIKTVGPNEISSITGKEICTTCGTRLDAAFARIDKEVKAFYEELEGMFTAAKKKFMHLDDIYNKFQNNTNDLHLRTRKELESLKREVIEGDLPDLPKQEIKTGSQSRASSPK